MEELLKLAAECSDQMVSCMNTKNKIRLVNMDAILQKEYWAGKEQAWYEALTEVNAAMKGLDNGKGD